MKYRSVAINVALVAFSIFLLTSRFVELSSQVPWFHNLDQDVFVVSEAYGLLEGEAFLHTVHPGYGHKVIQAYFLALAFKLGYLPRADFAVFETTDIFRTWADIIYLSRVMRLFIVILFITTLSWLMSILSKRTHFFGVFFLIASQFPLMTFQATLLRPELVSMLFAVLGACFLLKPSTIDRGSSLVLAGMCFAFAVFTKLQVILVVLFLLCLRVLIQKKGNEFKEVPYDRSLLLIGLCALASLLWFEQNLFARSWESFLFFSPALILLCLLLFGLCQLGKKAVRMRALFLGVFAAFITAGFLLLPFLSLGRIYNVMLRVLVTSVNIPAAGVYLSSRSNLLGESSRMMEIMIDYSGGWLFAVLIPLCFGFGVFKRNRLLLVTGCFAVLSILFHSMRHATLVYQIYLEIFTLIAFALLVANSEIPQSRSTRALSLFSPIVLALLVWTSSYFHDNLGNTLAKGYFKSENIGFLYDDGFWIHRRQTDIMKKRFPTYQEFLKQYSVGKNLERRPF